MRTAYNFYAKNGKTSLLSTEDIFQLKTTAVVLLCDLIFSFMTQFRTSREFKFPRAEKQIAKTQKSQEC